MGGRCVGVGPAKIPSSLKAPGLLLLVLHGAIMSSASGRQVSGSRFQCQLSNISESSPFRDKINK